MHLNQYRIMRTLGLQTQPTRNVTFEKALFADADIALVIEKYLFHPCHSQQRHAGSRHACVFLLQSDISVLAVARYRVY